MRSYKIYKDFNFPTNLAILITGALPQRARKRTVSTSGAIRYLVGANRFAQFSQFREPSRSF